MAGYVRQSTADIIPTATVRAAPINAEYNALRDAFAASGGHKHDGTSGEGEYVPLIADLDALNKVIIDTTNNRVGVFVEVSAAAVEQIRIQDGVIVPVTDNDIDLGTSSVEFKDLYLDGTAYIDTLAVHESATITSNFSVNGNTTLGNAASDTVTFTADVASSILPSADDTYDLGSSASQWRNLYIDGTANIDSLVADTADINGGTLDGVTIGGSTAAAADFTTMDASGNATVGGTLGVTGATTLASTLTVTGATALNGGLTLDTNKFTVADTTGNTAIAGTLDVTGATALASTLDVTGATTVADFTATGTTVLPATSFGDANITNVGNIALDSITADGSSITITGNTTFADGAYDFDIASHDTSNGLKLAGTLVTATATELNYNDTGSSVGTVVASKTVTVDGNKDVSSFRNLTATGDITTGNLVISDGGNIGSASDTNAISIASDGDVTVSQSMTVTGDLTVNGSTNTISTTNTVIEDALIELGTGTTGTPSNDAGIVIERGDSNNAFIGFDESEDKFKVGTGTFTGADTGNLTITTGTLVANIEGNLTGTVTGNASGLTGMNTAISELNVMDGDTSATSTTLADADRVVVNDAGTMKQVALTDFETYFESALDTLSNVTTVGTLNSGSITSGFGSIDNGSSAITTTGTITFGTLSDGSDSVTDIVTSVGSGSANSELPTALAVENRIQAISAISNNVTGLNATGAELNAVADVSAITIDTSTAIANNDGIAVFDSSASAIGYFDVDLLDTYFAGTTKTLTNKTLTSPTVSGLYLSDAGFIVEGSSADGNEATVTFTDPTADRTITFPDATGTVALSGATQNVDFGTITSDGLTVDGTATITTTGNETQLTLTSTDADATTGPNMAFFRNSSSAADGDQTGSIFFIGKDDAGNDTTYGGITTHIVDASNTTEDGRLTISSMKAGTSTETLHVVSGNVGIGVTPSAWGSAWVATQVGVGSSIVGRTTDYTNTNIVSNGYFDGTNWKYLSTNTASKYYQLSGNHIFDYAASGTAGNNITFSEAMRISSAGNVGIGISSAAQKLVISGGSSDVTMLWNSTDTAYYNFGIQKDGSLIKMGEFNNDGTAFSAAILNIEMNGDKVGIGTDLPDRPVHLSSAGTRNYFKAETTGAANSSESGFEIKTPSSNWLINSLGATDALIFYDLGNTSEAMRITSAGDLLVGTTDTTVYDNSTASSASNGHNIRADGKVDHARYTTTAGAAVLGLNRVGSDGYLAEFRKDGAAVGSISTHFGSPMFGKVGGARLAFATSSMYPSNDSGTTENGTLDIGTSSGRFKDLYLSSSIDIDAASGARIKFTDTGTQAYTIGNTGTSFNIYNESQSSEAMRIDSSGRVLLGHTSSIPVEGNEQKLQLVSSDADGGIAIARFNNNFGPYLSFGRSGSGTIGSYSAVPVDDELGRIQWAVADGTDMASIGASISAFTEQLAASNDVPSRLVFSTTANNASTPTERMRITSAGNVGIGTDSPQGVLDLGAASTGRALTFAKYNNIFGEYSEGGLHLASNYYGSTSANSYINSSTASYGAAGINISGVGGASNSGVIEFFTDAAASKTAGAAFVPTERMRIDSSGNVIIGAASAVGDLHVQRSDGAVLWLGRTTNSGQTTASLGEVRFGDTAFDSNLASIQSNLDGSTTSSNLSFYTQATGAAAAERMRISSTGDITIATGGDLLTNTAAGTSNFRAGFQAGDSIVASNAGVNNVCIGAGAGTALDSGDSNVAIGTDALMTEDDHANNVAIGYQALRVQDAGADAYNVAIGYHAGVTVSTGIQNTFVGGLAGDTTDDGSYNTAIGFEALGANCANSNVAVGYVSLQACTGEDNTAIGVASGLNLLAGNMNTFVGHDSGRNMTTGSKNVILGGYDGNEGGLDIRTSDNNIVLSDGDGNPRVYVKNGYFKSSNNNTFNQSAQNRHEFNQSASAQDSLVIVSNASSGAYGAWLRFANQAPNNTNNYFLACTDSAAQRFYIYSNGNVVNTNNSYGAISDVKLKENIVDSGSQWDDIKALAVRKYSMKSDNLDAPNRLGVIAQEVEAAGMGGLVFESPDTNPDTKEDLGTVTKQVNYSVLYMKAVKALQEAMDRIETLEAKVTALESA